MMQGGGDAKGAEAAAPINPNIFEHEGRTLEIREVWADNLEEEMANIRELVDEYCYVAMVRTRLRW